MAIFMRKRKQLTLFAVIGVYQDGETVGLIGKEETGNGVVQRKVSYPDPLTFDYFGKL